MAYTLELLTENDVKEFDLKIERLPFLVARVPSDWLADRERQIFFWCMGVPLPWHRFYTFCLIENKLKYCVKATRHDVLSDAGVIEKTIDWCVRDVKCISEKRGQVLPIGIGGIIQEVLPLAILNFIHRDSNNTVRVFLSGYSV